MILPRKCSLSLQPKSEEWMFFSARLTNRRVSSICRCFVICGLWYHGCVELASVCLTIEFLHTDPRPRIHRKKKPSPPLAVTTPRTLGGGSFVITGYASESLRLVLKDDGSWGCGLGRIWRAISVHTYLPAYIGMRSSFQFISYMIVSPVQFVQILSHAR
jgi:hypothetical protein